MKSNILPPYCFSGRDLEEVDGVVVHYFSGKNVDPDNQFDMDVCRRLFMDLNRPKRDTRTREERGKDRYDQRQWFMREDKWPEKRMFASAHVLIGRDGECWKLVEFDKQAYHAGASLLDGRNNCNAWTLGVELLGTQDSGFTKAQYVALVDLCNDQEAEHGFPRQNVVGHDHVRWNAIQAGSKKRPKYDPSGRKDGQGDNFDWFYFGKLWNDKNPNPAGVNGIDDLEQTIEADPNSGAPQVETS